MNDSELSIDNNGDCLVIKGALDLRNFKQAKQMLKESGSKKINTIDLAKVTRLDTAGALILQNAKKKNIKLENLSPEHENLLNMVSDAGSAKRESKKSLHALRQFIINFGKVVCKISDSIVEFITFTGQSSVVFAKTLASPRSLRFNSIIHHIKAIGVDAIPLISIIAFVISVVIAYQGQVQLKSLGAGLYTINLVAISLLREMGVLLTAIMIAGRTGSNFTAEIGVMKVRREVDALKTMGFDPFNLLVVPRLIALVITLPLLTLLADIMGLVGGAVISMSLMDVGLPEYLERVHKAASLKDFFAGMIKAPVFAFVIGLIGCMHGLKVSGSAESVGKETTTSVVKSIFLILIIDGLFSIYFQKVGL